MRVYSLCLVVLLGACSSGGGAASATDVMVSGPQQPIRLVPDTDPVDPADLPLTGRANFAGQLSLDLQRVGNAADERDTITSDLTLNVDFAGANAQVTGEADDFKGFDGRLFLSVGEIDRAASGTTPAISGRIAGTLKEESDSYLIFGTFDGDFRGSAQAAISGRLTGSVLNSNAQSGFEGSYQAGRLP